MNLTNSEVLSQVKYIDGDGHSIFKPESVSTETGVSMDKIEPYCEVYESDTSHSKSTIYVEGAPVDELKGLYGLSMIETFARKIGVQSECMGRGFRCSALCKGIIKSLEECDPDQKFVA